MLKRFVCLLLTGLMAFSRLPAVGLAGDGKQSNIIFEELRALETPVTAGGGQRSAAPVNGSLYAAEPEPGNVSEMPAGLALKVTASNNAPAVGDTVTYTLAPTGVTPSGNARPLKG